MTKKFMVYAKGYIEENDITIECHDTEDMNNYAQACREQGYKSVTTSADMESSEQKCRVCGCTWDNACPGGCYWVEDDLCSKCADVEDDERLNSTIITLKDGRKGKCVGRLKNGEYLLASGKGGQITYFTEPDIESKREA